MASGSSVRLEGADRLAAALARYPAASRVELRKSNLKVARRAREVTRAGAGRAGRMQAKMAGGIGSAASSKNAQLTVRNTARAPGAQAAFYGAKRRAGWYAAERYADSRGRQFPEWIGNRWRVAQAGEGPYGINDTLASELPELRRMYMDGQWEVLLRLSRARPGR